MAECSNAISDTWSPPRSNAISDKWSAECCTTISDPRRAERKNAITNILVKIEFSMLIDALIHSPHCVKIRDYNY